MEYFNFSYEISFDCFESSKSFASITHSYSLYLREKSRFISSVLAFICWIWTYDSIVCCFKSAFSFARSAIWDVSSYTLPSRDFFSWANSRKSRFISSVLAFICWIWTYDSIVCCFNNAFSFARSAIWDVSAYTLPSRDTLFYSNLS